ncbi:MAG: FdtA/QdtA family cupin domain-containing protein [Candidatus Levybacteria bacterium]|nr:FdtA/QdtA family cupin domain-containing protein [Candidatus Levybacteria bacterium]
MGKSLVQLVKIPKINDDCYLYFIQHPTHVPFQIKRVYFILDAHTKLSRGFHAHKKTKQLIFCIKGNIRLVLHNGQRSKEVVLDKPETGVLIDKMVWHEMHDFQKDTILLILASHIYNSKDYIRDYQKFLSLVKK